MEQQIKIMNNNNQFYNDNNLYESNFTNNILSYFEFKELISLSLNYFSQNIYSTLKQLKDNTPYYIGNVRSQQFNKAL